MFNKLSLLAFVAPLVSGLSIQVPQNPTSGGEVTINWTTSPGDPATFSFELVNEVFHNAFALANNVQPESGSMTLQMPIVPVGDGYTLEAVNIGNISDVFATTGTFSIGATSSSTVSVSASSGSTSGTSTGAATTAPVTTRSTISTSAFGTTLTTPASVSTGATTNAPGVSSSTGTNSASQTTSTNAAIAPLKMNSNVGAFAAVLFSAVAGAAIVAL